MWFMVCLMIKVTLWLDDWEEVNESEKKSFAQTENPAWYLPFSV